MLAEKPEQWNSNNSQGHEARKDNITGMIFPAFLFFWDFCSFISSCPVMSGDTDNYVYRRTSVHLFPLISLETINQTSAFTDKPNKHDFWTLR